MCSSDLTDISGHQRGWAHARLTRRTLTPACLAPIGVAAPRRSGFHPSDRACHPPGRAEDAAAEGQCPQLDLQPMLGILSPGMSSPTRGAGRDRAPPGARMQGGADDPARRGPSAPQPRHKPRRQSRADVLPRGGLGLELADGHPSQGAAGEVKPARPTRREVKMLAVKSSPRTS
jgi:hypothetical protein